jgi:hypothetical protein
MRLVRDVLAPPSVERARELLIEAQEGYAAAGLTGHFDPGVFVFGERDAWPMLCDLDRAGLLKVRVVASKVGLFDRDDAVKILAAAEQNHRSPKVRVNTLKIFVDGVTESHTSAYLDPYSDRPDTTGPLAEDEDVIRRWTAEADAAGLSCHFHALGDRAVRVALDAVAAVRAEGDSGVVHTICHAHVVDPADLPRFRELGVVYQTSSQWIAMDPFHDVMLTRLGDRALRQYPIRTAVDSGVTVTLPPIEEALPLPDAIRGMTASAAFQIGLGETTGMLRTGMAADLVVLGRNLFEIPAHEIAATPVVLTMCDGVVTHDTLA